VPIRRDFFDAMRDGRGLTAVLALYRPDLVQVNQLSFATDADATASASKTIAAALHSASRASCPCPLSADDFVMQTQLMRPVRVAQCLCACVNSCVEEEEDLWW
jgi:hypothetical protein